MEAEVIHDKVCVGGMIISQVVTQLANEIQIMFGIICPVVNLEEVLGISRHRLTYRKIAPSDTFDYLRCFNTFWTPTARRSREDLDNHFIDKKKCLVLKL